MTTKPAAEPLHDLPPLDSVEHILRRLQIISDRLEAGTFPKGNGGPAVRSCEAALKAIEAGHTIQRVKALDAEVRKLRAENERLRAQLAERGGLRQAYS